MRVLEINNLEYLFMNFDSVPSLEAKKEDLNGYFENVKKVLIDKTLERIKLAPDNSKGDALEDALKFYGALAGLTFSLDIDNIDLEAVQDGFSKLAQEAGLDPELVSIAKYKEFMDEADNGFK